MLVIVFAVAIIAITHIVFVTTITIYVAVSIYLGELPKYITTASGTLPIETEFFLGSLVGFLERFKFRQVRVSDSLV